MRIAASVIVLPRHGAPGRKDRKVSRAGPHGLGRPTPSGPPASRCGRAAGRAREGEFGGASARRPARGSRCRRAMRDALAGVMRPGAPVAAACSRSTSASVLDDCFARGGAGWCAATVYRRAVPVPASFVKVIRSASPRPLTARLTLTEPGRRSSGRTATWFKRVVQPSNTGSGTRRRCGSGR